MSHTILIADDDRQMVRTLCDVLALRGWRAVGVTSGEAAVEAVRGEAFDAVLMDIRMDGIDGVEALQRIRALRPGLAVFLMTAYSAAELLEEAARAGAVRVLSKPVPLPELLGLLAEQHAARRPILIVDDDSDYLRTLAATVRSHGRPVVEATDLDHAIECMHAEVPSAVVLDLRLGAATPRDSVFAIKTVDPAVMLILYSGSRGLLDETARAVPAAWVHGCLEKPFPPNRLLELIDAIPR